MAPLRKAPSASLRVQEVREAGGDVQAGRSPTSLRVERVTADIRRKLLSPGSTQREGSGASLQRDEPGSTANFHRRSSYAPAVSSPFNPSSSRSSVSDNECRGVVSWHVSEVASRPSLDGTLQSQSTSSTALTARGSRRSRTLNPGQQLPRGNYFPIMHSSQTPRPERPKLLQDLGRDYSRYPSSISTRSSYSGSSMLKEPFVYSESNPLLLRGTSVGHVADSKSNLESWGYPDDRLGAFDPYFGGEKGLILYTDEVEPDDKHHLPAHDDDLTFRPKVNDYFHNRAVVSRIGGIFLTLGLICLFIIIPVLAYSTKATQPSSKDDTTKEEAWAHVNNNIYPLLKNLQTGLIDSDTPDSGKTRKSIFDGCTLNLVFSDEFNKDGRTFYEGDDPYWTASNIWYGSTKDLEWYDLAAVATGGGSLQIRLDEFSNHDLRCRSGMLNSWNQFCFKGRVSEVSVSLAGQAGVPGLWPGLWAMGNLGRPGYRATTDGIWPYTYDTCDFGILPNQSSTDGISFLPGQKLSSCTCKGEDHPNRGTGRGAPEIDVIEAGVDPNNQIGAVTQSFQVAPFDIFYRPNNAFLHIPNYETTLINSYCGGPFQQAISGTTILNNQWYDGNAYQKYAFEYIPGNFTSKIAWFVGENRSFTLEGRAIGPNGNVGQRVVSQEPMSMVMNLGMSNSWSEILFGQLKFPTTMHVDYVRIYQKPSNTLVTCAPPGYPTTDYIAKHASACKNPNVTAWEDAGYSWPKNKLTGC